MRPIVLAVALILSLAPFKALAHTDRAATDAAELRKAAPVSDSKQDDGYSPMEIVGVSVGVVAIAVVAWFLLAKDNLNTNLGTTLPDVPEAVPDVGLSPNGMSLRWTF